MLLLNGIICNNVFSQTTGSMYMLQENFYSQMLNPSYMRNDKAFVIAVPGLAGATIGNSGNFKISDLVVKDKSGNMVVDIDNFYKTGNLESSLKDWSTVPWVFIGFPVNDGMVSIYLKEQVQSSLGFKLKALEFFSNGNVPINYRSYNTGDFNYQGMAYRELAVGYVKNINEKINIGVRGKILFGAALAEVNNWNYGINTTANGDAVELTSNGTGRLSLPVPLILNEDNRILFMNSKNAVGKYLGTFHNPGLAVDFGATIYFNGKSWLSVSANDIGAIWFRHNTMNITQDGSYLFRGFDISNSIESKRSEGYINPFNLMLNTKDSIRNVYRAVVDTVNFVQTLVPKTALHYQYSFNEQFSIGVTNQSAFYKNSFLNILTISALQKAGNFSIFENINLYGINTVTFGAGVQYEGRFGQVFAVTDNLLAVYHPARNESFSMSVGISILLNKPVKDKNPQGSFLPHLPFYENRN